MTIKLGDKVKDSVTGYEGIVTGIVSYLTGCDQVLITQKCKKGDNEIKSTWLDMNRVDGTDLMNQAKSNKGAMIAAPIK
jgi:hypothetical protein